MPVCNKCNEPVFKVELRIECLTCKKTLKDDEFHESIIDSMLPSLMEKVEWIEDDIEDCLGIMTYLHICSKNMHAGLEASLTKIAELERQIEFFKSHYIKEVTGE